MKVDENGQCIECNVPWCKLCSKNNTCIECLDDYVLKNDRCVCPSGNCIRPDGTCDPECNIPGCNKCSHDGKRCVECNDCNMKLENGQCICPEEHEKPNDEGKCSFCFEDNCIQCNPNNNQDCTLCKNGFTATNGKCVKDDD